jgi:hypothetical protein
MYLLFLLGSLFLYLGMAAQNLGLILSFILAPYFMFGFGSSDQRRLIRSLGLSLMALWLVWPIFNLISFLLPYRHSLEFPTNNWLGPLSIKHFATLSGPIFKSQIPSSIAVSGVLMWVLSFFQPRRTSNNFSFSDWIHVCAISIGLFSIYFIIQHVTGFDFRASQSYLPNMQFPSGTYRIQGFSGHPLTIAGISLGLVGISSSLLASTVKSNKKTWKPLAFILLANLFFLFASGGRTALAIGLSAVLFLLFYNARTFFTWKSFSILSLSVASLLGTLFYFSSIKMRFAELNFLNSNNALPNRFTFWQVHWQMFKDSPLWGQGYSHLSSGIRTMYYDALGYKDFPEKFNAHNMFFETISNIGLLGSLIVIFLLFYIYQTLTKLTFGVQLNYKIFKALKFAIVLNLIHGLTQNVFFDSGVTVVYTYLLWLVVWSTTKGEHFES